MFLNAFITNKLTPNEQKTLADQGFKPGDRVQIKLDSITSSDTGAKIIGIRKFYSDLNPGPSPEGQIEMHLVELPNTLS